MCADEELGEVEGMMRSCGSLDRDYCGQRSRCVT